jgi:hypothetical protein
MMGRAASYDIEKDGVKVAVLTFAKSAYRLGETVLGVVEVNEKGGRAVVLKVSFLFSASHICTDKSEDDSNVGSPRGAPRIGRRSDSCGNRAEESACRASLELRCVCTEKYIRARHSVGCEPKLLCRCRGRWLRFAFLHIFNDL